MHQLAYRIAALVLVLPIAAASDTHLIDRIEGYYSAPGRLCTEFDGGKYVPCNPPYRDCLNLKKVDSTHAYFSVNSFQRNGAECGMEGIAKVGRNSLEYVDHDATDPIAYGAKLIIHITNGVITFESIAGPSAAGQDPFCGRQGEMRWVKFFLKDKRPFGSGECEG
jgi:hypothetical protein